MRKISETLKAKYRPGGALHVADPFNAYLDRHVVPKPIMRFKNDPQISRFLLSEDKVCIYIIFRAFKIPLRSLKKATRHRALGRFVFQLGSVEKLSRNIAMNVLRYQTRHRSWIIGVASHAHGKL